MLDDEKGDFVGTAVREVEEETGIKLNIEDMVDLMTLLDPATRGRMLPSPWSDGPHAGSMKEIDIERVCCL
ncbi:Putative NUDIX hydrolase family protein [Zea mays]|uniref:Putative NUDIX hydrolase family protein n=1 Tax=Zea mays TaxID=4577 RepID=A0A1D6P2Y7_MAIZE|nr:Putative NUDIX hydrolase family protein [Zea mays]AQL04372.1 Putative NUDIX hydrolase family protein [Zea mays]